MREPKTWISVAILSVIALHALPILSYQGYRQTRWPILAWAMYAKSYPAGPVQTDRRRLVGVTAGGERIPINSVMAGVPQAAMGKAFIRPLMQGDSAAAKVLFGRLNRDRTDPVTEIQVEVELFEVTDTGLVTRKVSPVTYHDASAPTR